MNPRSSDVWYSGKLAVKVIHMLNVVLAVSNISKCEYVPAYSHLRKWEYTVPLRNELVLGNLRKCFHDPREVKIQEEKSAV